LSWDLLGAFLAVQKTGSLSGAARTLRTAQPTVRRQIEALEAALGVALFTRSPMGLAPTDAALAMLPYAESMAASAEALVRNASASSATEGGTVRVTASEVLGVEVLPAIFAELARKHPLLCIELSATNERLDLLRRDADVAVRMVQPTQGALVAKRVGSVGVGLFASEGYLASHGTPRTVAELSHDHALVGRDRDDSFYAALSAIGVRKKRRDFALRTDSDVVQLGAIRAGWGIGVCQIALAAREKGLRRVLPKVCFDLPVWVVTHEDLRGVRRVSVVFEHLVAALTKYAR
jgi:DNA-binding transcriptional LysR family regulator